MKHVTETDLLFVVGAPRSGTTWLHRMLAAHPDTVALDAELTVFTYLYQAERRFLKEKHHIDAGDWDQGAPLLFSEAEFYNGLRTIANAAYGRLLERKPEATCILDKHPAYAMRLPLIDRIYPNCRVVHIIRDGREVAVSMMSARKRAGFGAGDVEGAARTWAEHVRGASADGNKLGPDRFLEVRYEELMERPEAALKAIFQFAGLPFSEAAIAKVASEYAIGTNQVSVGDTSLNALRSVPDAIWRNKLDLVQRWTMDRMVGDLLRELHYAESDWWAIRPGDKARMTIHPLLRKLRLTASKVREVWGSTIAEHVH